VEGLEVTEFKREHRYFVFKTKDAEKYLTPIQKQRLEGILLDIQEGRKADGKADVETVCVDSDWPEYEVVWKMIEARVSGAAPSPEPAACKHGTPYRYACDVCDETPPQKPVATIHVEGSFLHFEWHIQPPNECHMQLFAGLQAAPSQEPASHA
jgi:hypothetical protein